MSKLASRRQKSRALQTTPCAAKRPAQDRRSWRSLSSERPRLGNACRRREIRLLAVLGRLKDCARVYTNRILYDARLFCGYVLAYFSRSARQTSRYTPAKTLSKAAAKNAVSLRAAGFPKSTPQPKNIWIPATKLRWGSSFPARARPRTGSARPRTQVKCTVCRRLQEASQPRWFLSWCLHSPE